MSRNYARIASKIRDANWLITESGLHLILEVFERRLSSDRLTDEEIAIRLQEAGTRDTEASAMPYQVTDGIATLGLYGPIFGKANLMTQLSGATSMEQFRSDFAMALADDSVKSIMLEIDSPGGTSDMIEEGGNEIFAGRDIKPIYALADSQAGSAAFWLGSQANKLYVTPSGEVGSVGAYTVHKDQSKRDAEQGLKYTIVSAGKYKTEGNPHEPLSAEGRDYRQEVINELYGNFVGAVARGRNVSTDKVESDFGQGRMVSSKKAVIAGMVDGVREAGPLIQDMRANHSTQVSFALGDKKYKAMLTGGNLVFDGEMSAEEISAALECADKEHAEPGTGSPPNPRLPEYVDPAIDSGSRRPDLTPGIPDEANKPGAPRAMNEDNFNRLCALFGVTTEDELVTSVTEMHGTASAIQSDLDNANKFAEMFPAEYARMQRQDAREREVDAKSFVNEIARFTRTVGEAQVQTEMGLSSLAQETIKDTYIKVASGKANLEDFTSMVRAIVHGGAVNFAENGTSRAVELTDIDTTTPEGLANARRLFASKVSELQISDQLSQQDALQEAAKRHPELANAYRATLPA